MKGGRRTGNREREREGQEERRKESKRENERFSLSRSQSLFQAQEKGREKAITRGRENTGTRRTRQQRSGQSPPFRFFPVRSLRFTGEGARCFDAAFLKKGRTVVHGGNARCGAASPLAAQRERSAKGSERERERERERRERERKQGNERASAEQATEGRKQHKAIMCDTCERRRSKCMGGYV